MNCKWFLLALSIVGFSRPAVAIERIHADMPLFSGADLQPVHFSEKDTFGCSSRIAFGDWKFKATHDPAEDRSEWMRLTNYGVFHCAMMERWSYDRSKLSESVVKYSWFVKVREAGPRASRRELWLLQSGARPGSDYLLLARRPDAGIIKTFDVLAVDCPVRFQRRGKPVDIWGVDYCAINSASDMRAFSRKMAGRPRVGTLHWVGQVPEAEEAGD